VNYEEQEYPSFQRFLIEMANWRMWGFFKEVDRMAQLAETDHICKRLGTRTEDPVEAEKRCFICGFCEKEAGREKREAARDA
jgi:hypothetical protein